MPKNVENQNAGSMMIMGLPRCILLSVFGSPPSGKIIFDQGLVPFLGMGVLPVLGVIMGMLCKPTDAHFPEIYFSNLLMEYTDRKHVAYNRNV